MSLLIGTQLPVFVTRAGADIPDVGRLARHAEELGLDAVWAGDHLTGTAPLLDSTVALSAAAATTERIRVGYCVMLLALRQTAWAARQLGSLQYASGGRLLLGVGTGGMPDDWEAAGVPSRGRGRRTDAMLEALPSLLGGKPTTLPMEPGRPVVTLQPAVPMPQVWIGGSSEAALRRTVEYGQGWLPAMVSPSDLAKGAARLTELAGERGRPRPLVGSLVFAGITDGRGTGGAEFVVEYLTSAYGMDRDHASAVAVGGPPEKVAERLAELAEAGAGNLVIVPFGADDPFTQYELIARARAALAG
jgi:alkanesulfonate monooxygenase SsuD/methylene tetrahydromethanopterin reductase-like flavin-dependent oxidoreductase (luciferase family)